MDFNVKKPLHILALILLSVTFIVIIVFPVLVFIGVFPSTESVEVQDLSENIRLLSELIMLVVQLCLIFGLLVIVPILWYILVNECTIKEAFSRLKLRVERIDMAFLWGIIAAIVIFIVIFILEYVLILMGYQAEELSNIPDIRKLFSWPTMFFLVGVQPIAEEFFFRGFLFEKIEKFGGGVIAIVATAFLFGLAHMSYGKLFPVIMPILIGIILGYIVYRTKNLYSSIIAHVVFNITVLTIAYVGAELRNISALIL
jgi:membrane protease YdiL (CAAX protease family)